MIQLEKGSKKFTCPKCQVKNKFVRYVKENGAYLSFDVGRCERQDSCRYHKKPKEFFAENPALQEKAFFRSQNKVCQNYGGNDKSDSKRLLTNRFDYLKADCFGQTLNGFENLTKLNISTIEKKYLTASLTRYEQNNFVYFLETLFDESTVKNLIDRFAIGTAKDKKAVFWLIDRQGFIRTGRIMLFDKLTGHRAKVVTQNWIHSVLQKIRVALWF